MCIPEFICGMAAMVLLEVFVTAVIAAVMTHSRKGKDQCDKDAVLEKE